MTDLPPVSRDVILDIALPAVKPTARVEGRRITMQPGVAGGRHVHNGPVFGVILEGSAVYEVEGGESRVLVPGDVFYEAEDATIARFDARDDGVVFIGYFLLGEGEEGIMSPL